MHRLLTKILAIVLAVAAMPVIATAQTLTVSGVVSDSDGPLPGVGVVIKGSSSGVATGPDGSYTLKADTRDVLVFSSLGYATREVAVNGRTRIDITLLPDNDVLEEVVVMGYGVQRKKVVTGATVQVKGDEIASLNNVDVLSSLKGLSPGVSITPNSGMPGDGFKVFIRGLSTTGSSSPLYVIDGVAGGDINNLNQSDIESIDILKDAASSAIYGARAANGVILITTKQGREGKATISYDMYYGMQNVYRLPEMLNARQYMGIQNEIAAISGSPEIDYSVRIPGIWQKLQDGTFSGTNWLQESVNKNAPTWSHAVNVVGGTDRSTYSMGVSYTSQEGVIGKQADPYYKRITTRLNSDYVLYRSNSGLDVIKLGENINFTYKDAHGIDIDDIYGNDIYNFLTTTPLMPLYNDEGTGWYEAADRKKDGWTINETQFNPIAMMQYHSYNKNFSYNLLANAYLEIQPIKNLKFRSSFGYKLAVGSNRYYSPTYYLCEYAHNTIESTGQSMYNSHGFTLDNTLSYNFSIAGAHNFDVMLGQSIEKEGIGETVGGSNTDLIFHNDMDFAWINNTTNTQANYKNVYGYPWVRSQLASFFGRINYNYKEKYLFSFIMRADGSSNFAKGHRWGFFPSVSAGWIVTEEDFMKDVKDYVSFLKVRASWGENGNCAIGAMQYSAQISMFAPYTFGTDKNIYETGAALIQLANPNITWETSRQTDIGLDSRFFSSRLGFSFDWYDKRTVGLLVQAPGLDSWGTAPPMTNGGDIRNSGWETVLSWNDRKGDLAYGVNFNISHNTNKVVAINNSEGIIHGPGNILVDGQSEIFRAQEGYPIGYFWGYKTDGVFQDNDDLDSVPAKLSSAMVGDLKFVDTNEDGAIDERDKVMIGNPHPAYNLGFGGNISWKGIDFAFSFYGSLGMQVARNIRAYNTTDILGRWTTPGSSDRYPRLNNSNSANWAWFSDINIENADFLKLQNVTLGYDFKHIWKSCPLSQVRIYVSGQNLLTFTPYNGMDPEIGYSAGCGWSRGVDLGYYPAARVVMFGANLKF